MEPVLLGTLSHGHRHGLLLELLLGSLLRCVFDDNHRLGCPLASDVVGIDVRCRTKRNTTFYQCQKLPQQHKK
jgi:hypothetical protein